jgi:uncharacterized protein
MGRLVVTIILILAIIFGYYWYTTIRPQQLSESSMPTTEQITIGGKGVFTVDVADTEAARVQGLSGRPSMAASQGMLFAFPSAGQHGFWMKDMHFPLDIIWFDQGGKLIYMETDLVPETYPEVFSPPASDMYVLEVNAGTASRYQFQAGDQLEVIN